MVITGAEKLCTIITKQEEFEACKKKNRVLCMFMTEYGESCNYAIQDYIQDALVPSFLEMHGVEVFYLCGDEAKEVCEKEGVKNAPLIQAYQRGSLVGDVEGGVNGVELMLLITKWYNLKQYFCLMNH